MQLKRFLLWVFFIVISVQQPCFAQKTKALKPVWRAARVPARVMKGGGARPGVVRGLTRTAAREIRSTPVNTSSAVFQQPKQKFSFPEVEPSVAQQLQTEEMQRTLFWLKPQNTGLPDGHIGPYMRSTFMAESNQFFLYSGTVFKITYQGQEEVYGVVASHIIDKDVHDYRFLTKNFIVQIYFQGQTIKIPAEIVAVGAPSTLDYSIVKFNLSPEEIETYFDPLPISNSPVVEDDLVRRQGFAENDVLYISDRRVLESYDMLFSSNVPEKQVQRVGLCGGAVINEQDELVGIHTGSKINQIVDDIGFATPAKFLPVLVEAYHNGGEAFYPFKMFGQTLVQLRPDEYISQIVLRNSEKNAVRIYDKLDDKMIFQFIEEEAEQLSAVDMIFTVHRITWKEKDGQKILDTHQQDATDPYKRIYRYDLQKKQLVPIIGNK